MWRYPLGSGGNRVTTHPPCLPAAWSADTRSRMKFEDVEDSGVVMQSRVDVLAPSWVVRKVQLEFYHRRADGRNGLSGWFGGGSVRHPRRHDVEVLLSDEMTVHAQP